MKKAFILLIVVITSLFFVGCKNLEKPVLEFYETGYVENEYNIKNYVEIVKKPEISMDELITKHEKYIKNCKTLTAESIYLKYKESQPFLHEDYNYNTFENYEYYYFSKGISKYNFTDINNKKYSGEYIRMSQKLNEMKLFKEENIEDEYIKDNIFYDSIVNKKYVKNIDFVKKYFIDEKIEDLGFEKTYHATKWSEETIYDTFNIFDIYDNKKSLLFDYEFGPAFIEFGLDKNNNYIIQFVVPTPKNEKITLQRWVFSNEKILKFYCSQDIYVLYSNSYEITFDFGPVEINYPSFDDYKPSKSN